MKYWRGYLTAAIFGAITWVLMEFGKRFTTLVDMIYPYVVRTMQGMLAEWSAGVDFNLWQLVLIAMGVIVLATAVLMVVLKWNPIQWFGWVLAAGSCLYMLHTLAFGLNYYAGPLAEDIRLEVGQYNLEELTEATVYYRDKANALALKVNRDGEGNVIFPDFTTLAEQAGEGFRTLTYDYSYPVFAGSTLPVKELAWADLFSSMGITGLTVGLTGEAAVNPQIPTVSLPFTMCREMACRMCIVQEQDSSFAAFLACQANESLEFQYSAYFMAYRYCYNALAGANTEAASAAAARVLSGVNDRLYHDLAGYETFFNSKRSETATNLAKDTAGGYLESSGARKVVTSYGAVCDLLVSWHIQQVVLPSIAVEENPFDPLDESQVDLSGLVNARTPVQPQTQEETQPDA